MEYRARKRLRLDGWNYSAKAAYFVTICVKEKAELLCKHPLCRGAQCAPGPTTQQAAETPSFALSEAGMWTKWAIEQIPVHYGAVKVDKYVIMPNHVHLIIVIQGITSETAANERDGCDGRTLCAPTLSRVIRLMKESVTKRLGYPVWQRSFHDHIIRNEAEYQQIWYYIDQNPTRWESDDYYKG